MVFINLITDLFLNYDAFTSTLLLNYDCWDIKDQGTSVCQSTAVKRLKDKVLLKIKSQRTAAY